MPNHPMICRNTDRLAVPPGSNPRLVCNRSTGTTPARQDFDVIDLEQFQVGVAAKRSGSRETSVGNSHEFRYMQPETALMPNPIQNARLMPRQCACRRSRPRNCRTVHSPAETQRITGIGDLKGSELGGATKVEIRSEVGLLNDQPARNQPIGSPRRRRLRCPTRPRFAPDYSYSAPCNTDLWSVP
jgi:hypothetical protein